MSENQDNPNPHRGLFVWGLITILILVTILLFKVNLRSAINSPQFQNNVTYIEEKSENIWVRYLSKPILYVWNNLFINAISQGMDLLRGGFRVPPPTTTIDIDQSTLDEALETSKIEKYFIRTEGD
jgi:hypothetical protein